jgi:hypothetical protein
VHHEPANQCDSVPIVKGSVQVVELVHAIHHSSTGGIGPLSAVIIGAAVGAILTLVAQVVIQLYIVPRVETRKRREDRWERNVLELGELLTNQLRQRAAEARAAQGTFRAVRQLEGRTDVNQERVARFKSEDSLKANQATRAYYELVHTRLLWLVDRIRSFSLADEIGQFASVARRYQLRGWDVDSWSEDDERTDTAFEEAWDQEYKARTALMKHVNLLANLEHPPRAASRLARAWRRTWTAMKRAIQLADLRHPFRVLPRLARAWRRTWAAMKRAIQLADLRHPFRVLPRLARAWRRTWAAVKRAFHVGNGAPRPGPSEESAGEDRDGTE